MTTWKDLHEKINRMRGAPPDADIRILTDEEQARFVEVMYKPGVLRMKEDAMPMRPYTTESAAARIRCFNEYHRWLSKRDTLLIRRLKAVGLNKVWVARVLDVLASTCNHCWDNDCPGCSCWNDE